MLLEMRGVDKIISDVYKAVDDVDKYVKDPVCKVRFMCTLRMYIDSLNLFSGLELDYPDKMVEFFAWSNPQTA